jgi:hypothetical protein
VTGLTNEWTQTLLEYDWDKESLAVTKEEKKKFKKREKAREYERVKKIYMVSFMTIVYGYLNFAKNPFKA